MDSEFGNKNETPQPQTPQQPSSVQQIGDELAQAILAGVATGNQNPDAVLQRELARDARLAQAAQASRERQQPQQQPPAAPSQPGQ